MMRTLIWSLLVMFVMTMPSLINLAEAKDIWKSYKLIKDGALNTSKWEDETVRDGTTIVNWSIGSDEEEGDYIKFDLLPYTAGYSALFRLVKCPECVKGIRVKVKMGTDLQGDIWAGSSRGPVPTDQRQMMGGVQLDRETTRVVTKYWGS